MVNDELTNDGSGVKRRRRKKDGEELDYEEYDEEEEQDEPENEIIDINRDEELDENDIDQPGAKRRISISSQVTQTVPIPPYSSMFIFSPTSK